MTDVQPLMDAILGLCAAGQRSVEMANAYFEATERTIGDLRKALRERTTLDAMTVDSAMEEIRRLREEIRAKHGPVP